MKYFTPNVDQFVEGLDEEMFSTPKDQQPPPNQKLQTASTHLAYSLDLMEQHKAIVTAAKAAVLAELPVEIGEHEIPLEHIKGTLTVKIPEKWEWDKDMLNDMWADNSNNPDYVLNDRKIDRKKLEKAEASARKLVRRALTIKMGTPTFKVNN